MIAAYSGNRKVYPAIAASLYSLLEHNEAKKVYLVIEDDIFPYPLPECAEIVNAREQKYFSKTGPNYTCPWSYFALIRAAYALMFPQHDRIISFDCDTLIKADISELWETDLEGYYFSASLEPGKSILTYPDIYTNVGVCLMNLKKLRADGTVDEILRRLNERRYPWPEQDVMNEVCRGSILNMPARYNSNPWTKPVPDAKIIHYAAVRFEEYIRLPEFQRYIPKKDEDKREASIN